MTVKTIGQQLHFFKLYPVYIMYMCISYGVVLVKLVHIPSNIKYKMYS